MADELKVQLITREFDRMLADLASIDPAVEFSTVVDSEAAKVCEGAMSRTVAARAGAIRERHNAATHTTFNGKRYNLEWRYPNWLWRQIVAFRRERLQTKLAARGLAKQVWLHAATKIGRSISAPSFVINANYRSRQYPEDVDVIKQGTGNGYTVTIVNNSPLIRGGQMPNALLRAMGGRARYYEQNLANRAFRTLESRARAYPGIWTSPVPPPAD